MPHTYDETENKYKSEVTLADIQCEIEKCQNNENYSGLNNITTVGLGKSKKGSVRYDSNLSSRCSTIASVINSDSRFFNLFTLHAALRLIDRYVDFTKISDTNTSIKNQSKRILDTLEEVLIYTMQNGITVQPFEAKSTGKTGNKMTFFGPKFSISYSDLEQNKKLQKKYYEIFGTSPITLGLGKGVTKIATKRDDDDRYPMLSRSAGGVICTIYSD